MAVGIYMDVHIPSAITDGLRLRGVEVLTAQEDGARTLADPDLLTRATELRMVLYTHDSDFLREADLRLSNDAPFLGVVFSQQMNSPIGSCIEDLEIIAKSLEANDLESQVEYIPF